MPSLFLARRGRVLVGLLAVALAVALIATLAVVVWRNISVSTADQSRALTVEVVSSPPQAVTGGDARVRVTAPPFVDLAKVRLTVDGRDATGFLTPVNGGLEGVVKGLTSRTSVLAASAPGVDDVVTTLSDHPSTGPLLAGPHEMPFICQTQSFRLVTGQNLGPPIDGDCSIKPRVDYVFRSTKTGAFVSLPEAAMTDPDRRPADLAMISHPDGTRTPFIVRVETRTINRGISQVAMLDDPAAPSRQEWNSKLIYTFGGGCDAGWYVQGTTTGGVMSPRLLSQGYAVASNSLNVFGQNCNDLLATETLTMTREQFIEDHGVPTYTMGIGCSGGSYQAQQIADNYPGLLDGIVVGCSFADVGFDVAQMLFDSRLLYSYAQRFPDRLAPVQLQLVSGFGSLAAVKSMANAANRMNPRGEFDPAVPVLDRYDPKKNPAGARSTIWDHTANVYGRFDTTGFARRPIDNVGVQYGLKALQDRKITVKQFLDLNAEIGGLDLDFDPTTTRTVADSSAVRAAYTTGRLLNGGGGLDTTPIIDFRSYTEGPSSTDLHMRYHTFVTQARLVAANGDADNEVLLTVDGNSGFDLEKGVLASAVDSMDQWIVKVKAARGTSHRTVVEAKPADLVDACWTGAGRKIVQKQTYNGPGECNKLYPSHAAPRLVAGEPLTSDIVSCTRRPVDPTEYGVTLTAAQLVRLDAIYLDGVCDWKEPGRWQRKPAGPWFFVE